MQQAEMVRRKLQEGTSGSAAFSRRQVQGIRERLTLFGLAIAMALAMATSGCSEQSEDIAKAEPRIAPLLKRLGNQTHPVATDSPTAQQFFDQGLTLTYAEAVRSFRQASLLDPDCAMAYWEQALALGPNLNAPISAELM